MMTPTVSEYATTEIKQTKYHAFVEIRQKNKDDFFNQIYFDFGTDILTAREFVQQAEHGLRLKECEFDITYTEEVLYYED